ncbi:MAG TPA: formate dehydrogenase accessory sulfurtransferase FdhD, partial [Thermoplasmata archaeon]|nr:formate dehydrogenase accessory sulfurtransferase FdhD [Thermoplasmata archaeon]
MNRPGPTTTAKVWKVRAGSPKEENDRLASEEPMEIRVESGDREHRTTTSLSVTMRTPGNDFELAAGFLFTEGIINRKRDVVRIEYCTDGEAPQEYNIVRAVL